MPTRRIDSSELGDLMVSLGQNPSPAELEKMIQMADIDGSGDIDFVEFVTLVAHKMKWDESRDNTESKVVEAFRLFDEDGSGSIDASEMKRMLINLGEKITLEEAEKVIRVFDQNGDGMIDVEEFAKAITREKLMGTHALTGALTPRTPRTPRGKRSDGGLGLSGASFFAAV